RKSLAYPPAKLFVAGQLLLPIQHHHLGGLAGRRAAFQPPVRQPFPPRVRQVQYLHVGLPGVCQCSAAIAKRSALASSPAARAFWLARSKVFRQLWASARNTRPNAVSWERRGEGSRSSAISAPPWQG